MDIQGKVAIVTGGASGIGAGLAKRFVAEGARGVVLADVNLERAQGVASEIGGTAVAMKCDVSVEADIQALVAATRRQFGQVDIFMSNAGILGKPGGIELEDALWDKMWQIHGMAHVWAARAVVPEMVARGVGVEVLHLLGVEDGPLDLLGGAEAVLEAVAVAKVPHLGLDEAAQVPGRDVLSAHDTADIAFEKDAHAGAQL